MSRSFTAIVNPISGGGAGPDRWRALAAHLSQAGAKVAIELTRDSQHAAELAREAADRGDVVVAVGGDGLVLAVTAGVVASGAGTMAIVAAGRGNDLARKLGIPTDPADYRALADLLLTGEPRPLDVLECGGTVVPGNVYAGLDSVSAQMINARRHLPDKLNYRTAPVKAFLGWKAPTFTITVDGATITSPAHIVVAANSGAYGHGLNIVPGAVVDDGLLDVLIVRATNKRRFTRFMGQAKKGTHVNRPDVTVLRGTTVTITADRPLPVGADGEDLGVLPVDVRIRPRALQVLAP